MDEKGIGASLLEGVDFLVFELVGVCVFNSHVAIVARNVVPDEAFQSAVSCDHHQKTLSGFGFQLPHVDLENDEGVPAPAKQTVLEMFQWPSPYTFFW